MKKIPYGISDFKKIQEKNFYYVDRTNYIEKLELLDDEYIIFLRPRRFGKSLFITMLHHYYGWEFKDQFQSIFGTSYIGKHPTDNANSYLILNLQFSGINTKSPENTQRDFFNEVISKIKTFFSRYTEWFDEQAVKGLEGLQASSGALRYLFSIMAQKAPHQKIYVLIDEYDHFANDLLSFDFEQFKSAVTENGWVRKFYEELKEGTKVGIVDKIFITGVSPITLDSMTSGFNISTNFSTDEELNEMMGFVEEEVIDILKYIGVKEEDLSVVLDDMRAWYDGYLFNALGEHRVYNPSMVLYFAKYYLRYKKYPSDLLDDNIASDYSKVRNMFRIANKEAENMAYLKSLLETGQISANLNKSFSFEKNWTKDDLVSLLFYNGILTIENAELDDLVFKIPNFVIRQLYYQYFNQLVLEASQLNVDEVFVRARIKELATQNKIKPLLELIRDIISQMGLEDKAHFNETSLKAIFASLFYVVGYYNIFSELEVRKSPTQKGRVDLLLSSRPPFHPNYQFVFELKYLRASQKSALTKVKSAAVRQLKQYLKHDDSLKNMKNLKAYVIIFVVQEAVVVEVQ